MPMGVVTVRSAKPGVPAGKVYARTVEGIGSALKGVYGPAVVVMVAVFDPTVTAPPLASSGRPNPIICPGAPPFGEEPDNTVYSGKVEYENSCSANAVSPSG